MKLAIVATHPIQYQVPWFRALASSPNVELKVYYAMAPKAQEQGIGFDVPFEWDIPLLDGYQWELLPSDRRSPRLGGFFGNSTRSIYSVLKSARPDVVIVTGWNALPLLQTLFACFRLGIPRLVRGESNNLRRRRWTTRIAHTLLLSRFDGFLAIGVSNRDFYLENGANAEQIFRCAYFVDNERFALQYERERDNRNALRRAWNITQDDTCFLFAGKLLPKKRIFDLLNAIDVARRSVSGIHLLVVGSGEQMQAARDLARSRNLPVTFAGFLNQTEISRAYVAADCIVLPSDYGETWGLVVNEAMVSGLPAIVSDRVGCAPDLIEEGVTGYTFPFGDVQALASRLVEFASNPDRLKQMAQHAREKIKDYSVECAVEGTARAVEYVIGKARRAGSETSGTVTGAQGPTTIQISTPVDTK